ncbi:MAG: ankyrin repeat domain-containing protein [Verrucomicrobiota bacterium]
MKAIHQIFMPVMVSIFSLVLATSCSSPEQEAKTSLAERGYVLATRDVLLAASAGDIDSLQLFEMAGFDLLKADSKGNTALMMAALSGRTEAVEYLLGYGADPRRTNKVGRDALILAASMGHEEASRLLISRGSDINTQDVEGWSALSLAAYKGHDGVVSLLASQVSPDTLDDALLVSAFTGNTPVMSSLLGFGANINSRSPESSTPLMIAAKAGHEDAVRLLLQNQANPYAVNGSGISARDMAEQEGHAAIRDLIVTPDQWGTNPQAEEVRQEMAEAREALKRQGAEETLTLSASSVPAPEAPQQVQQHYAETRRTARTKPAVALNGSTIRSRSPEMAPVQSMVLSGFHEEAVPLSVRAVEGRRAEVQRLDAGGQPLTVSPGNQIPGTDFRVTEVTKKFVSSKEGQGRLVDASRVQVENVETGATHLLVKDIAGHSADSYAILTAPNSQYRYVVKTGDIFRTAQPGVGEKDFQVLDIRPEGVVIKDLHTDQVTTVTREGVR